MNTPEPPPPPATAPADMQLPVDVDTVDKLAQWAAEADVAANRLGAHAGHHRQQAEWHQERAGRYLELASKARDVARMRHQLLEDARARVVPALEGEELKKALSAGVPMPPPVTPPQQLGDGSIVPSQRVCGTCQRVIREARPDEVDAYRAGRQLPDVTGECAHCRPVPISAGGPPPPHSGHPAARPHSANGAHPSAHAQSDPQPQHRLAGPAHVFPQGSQGNGGDVTLADQEPVWRGHPAGEEA